MVYLYFTPPDSFLFLILLVFAVVQMIHALALWALSMESSPEPHEDPEERAVTPEANASVNRSLRE